MANLISQITPLGSSTTFDIKASAFHYVNDSTGTAAVTSNPYTYAKWNATIAKVTSLYDGLTIVYKVPVAGNGSYGTCLQVNSLGYHPVVTHTNSMIGTRYGTNAIILLVYNSNISGTVYNNSGSSSTISGCWVAINDYDSGNTNAYMYYQVYSEAITKTALYRYQMLLTYDETQIFPINTVNNSTATTKTLTTEEFDPFGPIYYWNSTSTLNANTQIGNWSGLYRAYHAVDLRYSFNTGSTLTANKAVFLVAVPQSNGKAKLDATPITQEFPTTDDGKIYIYLGRSYSTYQITLDLYHPIYYYKENSLRLWTNAVHPHHTTGTWSDLTYTASSVDGASTLSFTIPTGTTSTTVALGNHAHSAYSSSTHVHGNITNAGTLTTTVTATTSDRIILADQSDSWKIIAADMSAATSTLLNSLGEGTSPATASDYIIAQYAGGGTTTKTYHRRKLSNVLQNLDKYHTTGSWSGLTYTASAVNSAGELKFTIPTGTTVTTVAAGNHTHSEYASSTHTHSEYATTADLNTLVAATDAMVFKGTLGTGGTITSLPASHTRGDTYRVITASTYAGVTCEVGDLIMCITTSTTANNAHWTVAQTNIDGAVTGPASATDGRIATFSGTSGKIIKDSGYTTASFASSTHTHATSLASDTGTPTVTLASEGKYKLTTGGTSVIFQMPALSNYSHPTTTAVTASAYKIGNDSNGHVVIGDALTAADVGAATSSHSHGVITSSGYAGTASNKTLYTTTSGSITYGTLPVAAGGTGVTSFAVDSLIASASTSTGALTTRGMINNTANTAIVANTNIPTMNTIYYGLATINGNSQSRETNILVPTTTAPGANAIVIATGTGTNSIPSWKATANGALYSTGTNSQLTFGTLPIAQGGTGATDSTSALTNLGAAAATHSHGSLTNDGKVGSTSGYVVITGTGGAITASSLAVTEPSASGTATQFIATASQNSNGKIVVTKASLPNASTTTSGIIKIGTTANDAAAGNHTHSDYALSTHTHSDYSTGVTIRVWS